MTIPHLALLLLLAAPTTSPTSSPTRSPTLESLGDTGISFSPPTDWIQVAKAKNGRTIAYRSPGGSAPKATMAVNVDVQKLPLREPDAEKIGLSLCKLVRDNAAKAGTELIEPPRVEKDDRFFLRIHHRSKKGEKISDQLQLYRAIDKALVAVAVTVETDAPDEAKPAFEVAESVMLGVKSPNASQAGAPATHPAKAHQLAAKPTLIGGAKIQVPAPVGWRPEINATATSGIVATFRDAADETNLIAVSVRPLPKEARTDPKLRDALVDELVAGERTQFKIDGGEAIGDTTTVTDRRFLRKSRTRYAARGTRFDVCSRQLRAGDAVVSVTLVCLDDQFETMDKLADQLALAIRASAR